MAAAKLTDRQIRDRRTMLDNRSSEIHREWKAYDARYPVEVGAYKPSDYDRQQLRFVERLQEVSAELSQLPMTKVAGFRRSLLILAVLGGLSWLIWRIVF
jgi:hypothetical protein